MSEVTYNNVSKGISHEQGSLTLTKDLLTWKARNSNEKISIKSSKIKHLEWLSIDRHKKMLKITFIDKNEQHLRFIGFGNDDEYKIDSNMNKYLNKKLTPKSISTKGVNWGRFVLRSQEVVCRTENKHILFTVPYNTIKQSVIQARNEISFEFKEDIYKNKNQDELCEMRIYIPDDDDENGELAYKEFNDTIVRKAELQVDKSQIIAWFKSINFKVPRGKKEIQFFPKHFLFRGDTFSYNISYKQIKKLFVFEQPNEKISFLVSLSPAIRQGSQTYGYLIMEFPEDEICTTKINATEEDLKNKYISRDGKQVLKQEMEGATYDILSRVFMGLSQIKIIAAKKFESAEGYKCINCSYGPNQGLLYPLDKGMFFIWKPVTHIRHSEIYSVEFLRLNESLSIKSFDLSITLKKNNRQKIVFTNIDKSEYNSLVKYILSKDDIQVENKHIHLQSISNDNMNENSRRTRTRSNLKKSAQIDNQLHLDDDDDDDEDYDMENDKNMLKEDEKLDDKLDQLVNQSNTNSNEPSNDQDNDDDDDDDPDDDLLEED